MLAEQRKAAILEIVNRDGAVRVSDLVRDRGRLLHDRLGESRVEIELSEDALEFGRWFVGSTKDFDYFALRVDVALGPFVQLDHDLVADLGRRLQL